MCRLRVVLYFCASQALRYRESAGSRAARVTQLEAEVASLKAALQSLSRK